MTQRYPSVPKVRPGFPARLVTGAAVSASGGKPVLPRCNGQSYVAPAGVGLDSMAVRQKMVAKIAQEGVNHPRVLAALAAIDRHRFVDSALVNQAYEDTSLPIGLGQTISKPSVVARMLALLCDGVAGRAGRVLEIGTGCGYQAVLLGQLFDEVYSIERLRGLHDKARDNLRHLRLANVHLLFGDGMQGYAKGAPTRASAPQPAARRYRRVGWINWRWVDAWSPQCAPQRTKVVSRRWWWSIKRRRACARL